MTATSSKIPIGSRVQTPSGAGTVIDAYPNPGRLIVRQDEGDEVAWNHTVCEPIVDIAGSGGES